jgi:O-antigen ligase
MGRIKVVDAWFILVLILFAYSGMIKWIFIPVEIDPTILFFILSLPILLFKMNFKFFDFRNPLTSIIPIFLFFNFLLVFTCIYTISEDYYVYKSILIISNSLIFTLPLFALRSESSFKFFKLVFKYLFLLCLLLLIYEFADNQFTRIRYREYFGQTEIGLPNYLTFSYFLGGCIILFINSDKIFDKAILFIALLIMILLAAKGPLLFLFIVMIIKMRKSLSLINFRFWFYLVLSITFVYIFTILLGFPLFNTLFSRLSFFSDGLESDESSLARVMLLKKGVDLILDNFLFGVGIGGFSKAIGGPDDRLSPHNILIEVWAENGIIPFVILFIIIILYFKKFIFLLKKFNSQFGENIIYLCFFIFLSNMVSSYLEDLRITYFWLGVATAFYTMNIKLLTKQI